MTPTRIALLFSLALAALPSAASALDGGYPARAEHLLRRAAVAIQVAVPLPDGRARVSDCTGTLIARDLILTAGHCVEAARGPADVAVVAFGPDGRPVGPLKVAALALHPAHKRGWWQSAGSPEERQREIAADLALIRLKAPAPGDAAPVRLGYAPRTTSAAGSTYIAGAGLGPGSKTFGLRIAPVGNISLLTHGAVIALGTPEAARACRGDSGAALVRVADGRAEVWGVASAILRASGGCSSRIAIALAAAEDRGMRAMFRAVGR